MSRTWLATYLVSTTATLYHSDNQLIKHPTELAALLARTNGPGIPRTLAAEVTMFVLASKHNNITSTLDLTAHESLLEMHCLESDNIAAQYSDAWNDWLTFLLISTKLYMRVPFLLRHRKRQIETASSPPSISDEPHAALLLAITDACRMITLFDTLTPATPASPTSTANLPFWTTPKPHFRALCHAVCFLLKFVIAGPPTTTPSTSPSLPAATTTLVSTHMELAIALLGRASRRAGDEPHRAAVLFRRVLDHGRALLRHSDNSIGETRGSGSVFWDVMHQSYRLRGAAVYRTDLVELIEPVRSSTEGSGAGAAAPFNDTNRAIMEAGVYTPGGGLEGLREGSVSAADVEMLGVGAEDWIGSVNELSDLGLLYLPDAWATESVVS